MKCHFVHFLPNFVVVVVVVVVVLKFPLLPPSLFLCPHNTGGQNLAKLDICAAKCIILDVSGKFQDLWERYYADADAVIFCWRLDHPPQHALLEMVRGKISDDIPFLIFGHEFDWTTTTTTTTTSSASAAAASFANQPQSPAKTNFVGSSSTLLSSLPTILPTEGFLPHYHSNLMMAFCGSAHNGAGVRDAMEWLIPLAKRQAKLRLANHAVPNR
jgi:hypothetical protein